jgi:hypothetical protein
MVRHSSSKLALAAVALAFGLSSCKSLEVINPNAPERERAFSDPATIVSAAAGAMKTWINTRFAYDPSLTLSSMADSYSFSWNNFNSRYYSSYGKDCPNRCGWVNSTQTGLGFQVQSYWYGMYSALSSANDALFAIREAANPPDLGDDADRTEVIAQLVQAMTHAFIALNYDQGFIVLEDTDPSGLELSTREEIRNKAIELYDKAVQLANASTFDTPAAWFGAGPGQSYTSSQIAKIARTGQAELLAHFPRNEAENGQVNWGQVATYASQGISSGAAPFDFRFYQDENATFRSQYHWWGNDYTTVRVDTRVARLISTGQTDPWPGGAGNPQPVAGGLPVPGVWAPAYDKRLGDGTYGDEDGQFGLGEKAATAFAGTDMLWSPVAIFIPGRGTEHQSNIGYHRFRCVVGGYPECPSGADYIAMWSKAFNDLLWAEGLIRSNGSKTTAADKINNTRRDRGGLPPLTGTESTTDLLRAMYYEQELELMPLPATQYFNRRRVTPSAVPTPTAGAIPITIWPDTPRHMPIPAKDLQLLQMEIYTFGGQANPAGQVAPREVDGRRVKNVREIWAEIEKIQMSNKGKRPH